MLDKTCQPSFMFILPAFPSFAFFAFLCIPSVESPPSSQLPALCPGLPLPHGTPATLSPRELSLALLCSSCPLHPRVRFCSFLPTTLLIFFYQFLFEPSFSRNFSTLSLPAFGVLFFFLVSFVSFFCSHILLTFPVRSMQTRLANDKRAASDIHGLLCLRHIQPWRGEGQNPPGDWESVLDVGGCVRL